MPSRRHGNGVVGLTSTGRTRLARARRSGEALQLPEAPQHRRSREARAEAARQIDAVRAQPLARRGSEPSRRQQRSGRQLG
jgi:hypothetical protein